MLQERAQQSPIVAEARGQELSNKRNEMSLFLSTHSGLIIAQSDIDTIINPDSREHNLVTEALKRSRPFAIILPQGLLGEGENHLDTIDRELPKDSQLAPIQKIAKSLNITPENLQNQLNVANTLIQKGTGYQQTSFLMKLTESMENKFIGSSDTQPTQERNLLGVTSNIDEMIRLNQSTVQERFDLAINEAVKEGSSKGQTPDEVIAQIDQIIFETDCKQLPAKIETMTHALGYILRTFRNPGGKVSITNKDIINQLERIYESSENKVKIGGASAQLADLFTAIGEAKSTLYTQFHSPEQAKAHKYQPDFLRVKDNGYTIANIQESANPNDPTKKNLVFEIPPSTRVLLPNGKEIVSKPSADRIIFPADAYFDSQGHKISSKPLFDCNQEVLGQLVKKENILYFFLNGAQYAQRVSTLEEFNNFTNDLTSQLQQIKQSGAVTHFEFSGNTERKDGKGEWTGVRYFEALRNNIDSFGLGDSEVLPVLKAIKAEAGIDSSIKICDGEDSFSLYKNGLTLLKSLNVQRVYIHGLSNDIVILDNSQQQLTSQDMDAEVNACFFAKDKVTHHIKGDTPQQVVPENTKLSRFLKTKGINQMSEFIKSVIKDFKKDKKESAQLIDQISKKGYFFHQDHAAVIIPVKWIYRQDQVKVTVSAGDITSYISTLYSGLAERIKRSKQSTRVNLT